MALFSFVRLFDVLQRVKHDYIDWRRHSNVHREDYRGTKTAEQQSIRWNLLYTRKGMFGVFDLKWKGEIYGTSQRPDE